MRLLVLFVVFLYPVTSSFTADIHVPDDYSTIQAAIDAASPHDTVLVGPGTYVENVVITEFIHLISTDGPEKTVIDASSPQYPDNGSAVVYHNVSLPPDFVVLEGFTLTNGTGTYDTCIPGSGTTVAGHYGGGLLSSGTRLLCRNNIIMGNVADAGGGVTTIFSHNEFVNCLIQGNTATSGSGGGLLFTVRGSGTSVVEMKCCTVTNNTSAEMGIGLMGYSGIFMIHSCLIAENVESSCFGALFSDCDHTVLQNCTFTRNNMGIGFDYGKQAHIYNCIFWDNDIKGSWDGDEIFIGAPLSHSLYVHNACVEDGTNSIWLISSFVNLGVILEDDPLFADPENHDFRLSYESGLIDIGTHNMHYPLTEFDFEGDPRRYDGDSNGTDTVDYGCDEYTKPKELYIDDDWVGYSLGDEVEGHIFGISAFNVIQDALDGAYDPSTVFVADGIYTGTGNRELNFNGKSIHLKSINGPAGCVIDCEAMGIGFAFENNEDENAVVDGITVTNAYTQQGSGGMQITNASPTIRNCRFLNNAGGSGGAITTANSGSLIEDCLFEDNYLSITPSPFGGGGAIFNLSLAGEPSPRIYHCIFRNNDSLLDGGAIYNMGTETELQSCCFEGNHADRYGGGIACFKSYDGYDATRLVNCIFYDNLADAGGGMSIFNDETAPTRSQELVHCTFSGNTAAGEGGALFNVDSDPAIYNCIFWGNGPDEVAEGGTLITHMTFSCIEGGFPGMGNIDSDPLFVNQEFGDLHLSHPSPCKNVGTHSPSVFADTDFEGDPRIVDNTVDMGADEFHPHLYYTGNATSGGVILLKTVGKPGDMVRLWVSAGIMDPPLQHPKFGDWYLKLPVLLGLILGPIPSPEGVMVLPITIPLDNPVCAIPMQAGIEMGFSNLCVVGVE